VTRFARLLCVESDNPAEHHVPGAGRIRFAGEHLSEAYPGYMNGGAQTGRVAAEAISGRRSLRAAA
jgi:monoamine oxidase